MLTTAFFLPIAQWVGIGTLLLAALTVVAFIFKWDNAKFRLVGATGFSIVLTAGLFTLTLGPLTRTQISGGIHYSLVYDNGATQVVIAVPPTITNDQLEATMLQAAGDLFSYGRFGSETQLTIRVRANIHPEKGITKPLYLGQVKRALSQRNDEKMEIEIFSENLAQLPKSSA